MGADRPGVCTRVSARLFPGERTALPQYGLNVRAPFAAPRGSPAALLAVARCRAGQVSLWAHPPIAQPSLTPCHSTPPQLHERSTFLPHQREATWQGTTTRSPAKYSSFFDKISPLSRKCASCFSSFLRTSADFWRKRTEKSCLLRKCTSCWAELGRNLSNQRRARAAERVKGLFRKATQGTRNNGN